jgi:alkanesulfonate monooxygenase SsuD/methylene tetrahydromethanopterin reductase-like flavin-dependent oxidoreductase (luciferase family)
LARVAEQTSRIGIGAAVLIPSYRHPVAQASAIATLEALAPGRLWAGFGTRDELRPRLAALEAAGATGVIFGTSGADVEREMHAFAEVVGL